MKPKLIIIAAIIAMISTSSTCKKNSSDCHSIFTIKNNSGSDIYFIWSRDSALNSLGYNPRSSPSTYKVEMGTPLKFIHSTCLENEILASSSKMLYLFIFDAKIIETVPWDSVKKNYMLLKKFSLTEMQLDNANWIIDYP